MNFTLNDIIDQFAVGDDIKVSYFDEKEEPATLFHGVCDKYKQQEEPWMNMEVENICADLVDGKPCLCFTVSNI